MGDDVYSGFNETTVSSHELMNDASVREAIGKSSHGRRATAMGGNRLATAAGRVQTATGGLRPSTGMNVAARPMTAVRGAGYNSRTSSVAKVVADAPAKPPPTGEDECRKIEKRVNDMLDESTFTYERGDYRLALEKAKEAGRMERKAVKRREQLGLMEGGNLDLTFNVLFNLAHQYNVNDMYNEALNTYQVIVKNKQFTNAGRLKVNIGNIYFRKKDYSKAIKHYRMALDQINNIQKESRIKLLNNIGVAFVKLGKYDEAIATFEQCMEEQPDSRTCLNLLLCAYTLADTERMKDSFVQLLEIPLNVDDEDTYTTMGDDSHEAMLIEVIKNDSLRQWEKKRRHEAERSILTAARLISPAIAPTFSLGYTWCVESIKQSLYSDLASELEINKAIQHLRQRDLAGAAQILQTFEKKESKVASAAANNLAFVKFLQRLPDEAAVYAEQAIANDRYNSNALVNRGNVHSAKGDTETARHFYREALTNEASCVEALYNQGLACKQMHKMEEALDCFYKLHNILRNNVQVLCQIASIYETLEDSAQAIELLSQASNLAPTDPGILAKLGDLYDMEGDKSQAFQCYYDSYRFYPSNIEVIEWLGAYYIDAQFCEKAVNYFERASIMQPGEVRWQLMMASCHRRSGNYQKALETYKFIHRRFPDNVDCLKFLVRLCTDMALPEAQTYASKLKKVEKVRELRDARGHSSGSAGRLRSGSATRGTHSATPALADRSAHSRGSIRTTSANIDFGKVSDTYEVTNKTEIDTTYRDTVGPARERPKTGAGGRRINEEITFDNDDDAAEYLPE